MRVFKKKRPESTGWIVGTSDEFLGLSPEEAMVVETKLALSDRLPEDRASS
jgi:hypothetical protein